MTTNIRAARAVAILVPDRTEARHFLEMLGLVDGDNRITPDDTRAGSNQGTGHRPVIRDTLHANDKPKYSTAPEALRVLAPVVKAAAIPAAKKVKSVAEGRPSRSKNGSVRQSTAKCGTPAGYNRHRREGTGRCQLCLDAHNAESRKYEARRRDTNAPTPVRRKAECGTLGGRRAHFRNQTPSCAPCREADRVATAARRAAKRAA